MNSTHPVETLLLGWLTCVTSNAATMHYVDVNSIYPQAPYTDWASAANTIQDAVDVASDGEEIVVTNGVYQTGGRAVSGHALTNRVAVTKPLALRSVNGPEFTVIHGCRRSDVSNDSAVVRCVYLTYGATLSGFTLMNGASRVEGDAGDDKYGGGVWCAAVSVVVSNCVLNGNK